VKLAIRAILIAIFAISNGCTTQNIPGAAETTIGISVSENVGKTTIFVEVELSIWNTSERALCIPFGSIPFRYEQTEFEDYNRFLLVRDGNGERIRAISAVEGDRIQGLYTTPYYVVAPKSKFTRTFRINNTFELDPGATYTIRYLSSARYCDVFDAEDPRVDDRIELPVKLQSNQQSFSLILD
jgi:hypothetical protein